MITHADHGALGTGPVAFVTIAGPQSDLYLGSFRCVAHRVADDIFDGAAEQFFSAHR